MDRNEREDLYRRARAALDDGMLTEASAMFEQLVQDDELDARFLSYHGLLTAIRDRQVGVGEAMCKQAITLASTEVEMHLNLARLYSTTGQRDQAVEALRRAIRSGIRTEAVMREIQRLSPRAKPPIPSLHRDHFLNDILGRLRAKLFKRRGKSKSLLHDPRQVLLRAAREAQERG